MVRGIVVGIVQDNQDPDKLHRVLVRFPVESEEGTKLESHWCRLLTPLAGAERGLVWLPEVGSEVVIGHATRSKQPYVLGCVYNGQEDAPEPYKNDDGDNNLRVLWTRGDHLVIFDDTDGAERVQLGAKASTRLDATSGAISHDLDAAGKTLTECNAGSTDWEAKGTVSIKCKDFKLTASGKVGIQGATVGVSAKTKAELSTSGVATLSGKSRVDINPSKPAPAPTPATAAPAAKHPPAT